MISDFCASLVSLFIMAFMSAVSMGFYYLAIHRPSLKKIIETGEPPAIWRYGLARYGHTVLSTRIGAVMLLVCYALLYLVTATNGFGEWCGFTGWVFILCTVMMYFDHTLAKPHLKIPIKLLGLSGVPVGIGLLLMWLVYWYVIDIPVKVYFFLNSVSLFMAIYVMLMPMRSNTSSTSLHSSG